MSEPHCEIHSGKNFEKHWNDTYLKTPTSSLGWYEEHAAPSLELIEQCALEKDDLIVNVGSGTTTLIESLLEKGYSNFVLNDIAVAPLTEMRSTLNDYKNATFDFIIDDLTKPDLLLSLKDVALWHDRAVLHFFTEEKAQNNYFELLGSVIKLGGYVILAEFNLEGAQKCSGLPVVNYSVELLKSKMGSDFKLVRSFDYTYTQPLGDTREFVYTLFQRIA